MSNGPSDKEIAEAHLEMGMEIRKTLLYVTLKVESSIEEILVSRLRIEENAKKKPIQGLKFEGHLSMLFALNVLSSPERERLDWFRKIRNTFIHKHDANTLENGFKFVGDEKLGDRLIGVYKVKKEGPREEQLAQAVDLLLAEIADIIHRVREKVIENETDERLKIAHVEAHETYKEMIPQAFSAAHISIQEQIAQGHTFTNDEIQGIPKRIANTLDSLVHPAWRAKMKVRFGEAFVAQLPPIKDLDEIPGDQ